MKTASWIAVVGLVTLAVAQADGQMMRDSQVGSATSAGTTIGAAPTATRQNTITTRPVFVARPQIRRHEHRRVVILLNSCPFYYPSYGYFGDYDSYDPAPDAASRTSYEQGWYVASNTTAQQPDERSYRAGRDWGQDLRRDVATWDQFVDYLRAYIVNASVGVRDEFRRGFAVGYGSNADAAFDKGLDQANQQTGHEPKVITIPRKDAGTSY
jgi:hypothetical protein